MLFQYLMISERYGMSRQFNMAEEIMGEGGLVGLIMFFYQSLVQMSIVGAKYNYMKLRLSLFRGK